eukprot:gb/GEZN01000873.1/.p1 GENE.gb/GEZN01000873.1/~~gb/GEZN01000873.1/.p1  ORF type:complete len:731 (+),score=107.96 gb/GEZN01000873.1/:1256-3448(+)
MQLLQVLDVEEDPEKLAGRVDQDGDGRFQLDEVCAMFASGTHAHVERGRYFLLLSLAEAETLMRVLHMARAFRPPVLPSVPNDNDNTSNSSRESEQVQELKGRQERKKKREEELIGLGGVLGPQLANTQVALWNNRKTASLTRQPLALLGTTTGRDGAVHLSSQYQHHSAMQSFRFCNSDTFYQPPHLRLLLTALANNPPALRKKWFLAIRKHRRRQQEDWEWRGTSLARVFTLPDQYHLLAHRARLAKIRAGLRSCDLYPMDAFRSVDADKDGVLSPRELALLFHQLAIPLSIKDAEALVQHVLSAKEGDPRTRNGLTESQFCAFFRGDLAHLDLSGPEAGEEGEAAESPRAAAKRLQEVEEKGKSLAAAALEISNFHQLVSRKKAAGAALEAVPLDALDSKGKARPQGREDEDSEAAWDCAGCTFRNAGPLRSCEMCGSVRPVQVDGKGDGKRDGSVGQPPLRADLVAAWSRPAMVSLVRRLRVSVLPVQPEKLICVWTSNGTRSPRKISIWRHPPLPPHPPPQLVADRRGHKVRLVVGQYAGEGYKAPSKALEVCVLDTEASSIGGSPCLGPEFLELIVPYPVDYQLVWQHRTGRPLYVWQPVPPSDLFSSLGMVFTVVPRKPGLKAIRCIPTSWLIARGTTEAKENVGSRLAAAPSKLSVVLPWGTSVNAGRAKEVWSDAPPDGAPGSLWVVNSLGLVHARLGFSAPSNKGKLELLGTSFQAATPS